MVSEELMIGKYISILYRQAQGYLAGQMKELKIGSGQYAFLLALYQHNGISQEELSNRLMIDKGTTAKAVSKLESAGYVVRKQNPEDRRSNLVYLTKNGWEVRSAVYDTLQEWTGLMLRDISSVEREILLNLLEKVVDSTMKSLKENRGSKESDRV